MRDVWNTIGRGLFRGVGDGRRRLRGWGMKRRREGRIVSGAVLMIEVCIPTPNLYKGTSGEYLLTVSRSYSFLPERIPEFWLTA
jgi:hypothetical protein